MSIRTLGLLLALWLSFAALTEVNGSDPVPLFSPVASLPDSLIRPVPVDVATSSTGKHRLHGDASPLSCL